MRILPINNQRPNNKPAFGMAITRINTAGMTNLEKQAVLESLPELQKIFTNINGEIALSKGSATIGRQFNILASDPRDANKTVFELVSSGAHYHSNDNVGLKWLKLELFKNAESSIATYFAKNKNLAQNAELDNSIAKELNKSQQRIADNVRTQTGLTATVE